MRLHDVERRRWAPGGRLEPGRQAVVAEHGPVLERARREANTLRDEADVYVVDVLSKLEENLLHSLSVVRNGLRKLEDEEAPGEQQSVPTPIIKK